MKKALVVGTAILGFGLNGAAMAASSVAGKTFDLTGKFGGSVSAACRIGGSRSQKVAAKKNLTAQITFNEDGTFNWSNDTLGVGVADGTWTQKGSKLDLDFDDPTAFSYIRVFGDSLTTSIPGGSATVSPTKYDFRGTLNGKGTSLSIVESGGFKINASAAMGGGANACTYKYSVNRKYKGKSQ